MVFAEEADGAVFSILELNGHAFDDDSRTDTPGSTLSFSSWMPDVEEFMSPVDMRSPAPSVDFSNSVTDGDDDDSDSFFSDWWNRFLATCTTVWTALWPKKRELRHMVMGTSVECVAREQ